MRPEYGTAGMNGLTCGKTLSSTAPAITRKRSYNWRIIPFSGLAANKASVLRQEQQLHVRTAVSSADWPVISQSGDKDCFTSYGYLRGGPNVVFLSARLVQWLLPESRFGPAVRCLAGKQRDLGSIPFRPSCLQNLWSVDSVLWLCPSLLMKQKNNSHRCPS